MNNRGYGVFCVGRRVVMAHRRMFELGHGLPPSGMTLHTCDKKTCVNPSHLYEGSKPNPCNAGAVLLEEIERKALPAASSSRGRPGINNPRARLTEEQVKPIRVFPDQGVPPRMIGSSFGVDAKSIRNIDEGKTWSHVPEVARQVEAPKKRRRGG
ncbi:hypothetical protein [Polyangium sp. 15x6]|uniref:hypothetical protein n=1 Tax=Polyangium sp. 15x6 TaxID=3042687 RepID=UPI00249A22E1|nr:hypothetical protein [Polyangium sp. 15x6]MDI3290715.1 hypothetical protein [Polyangium sp. 15x6]